MVCHLCGNPVEHIAEGQLEWFRCVNPSCEEYGRMGKAQEKFRVTLNLTLAEAHGLERLLKAASEQPGMYSLLASILKAKLNKAIS